MEKSLFIQDLHTKTKIKVTCDGNPDFCERTTLVLVYLNGNGKMDKPDMTFYAESLIFRNNQPQRSVFDIDVPAGTKSVHLVFSTNRVGHTLDAINAYAV